MHIRIYLNGEASGWKITQGALTPDANLILFREEVQRLGREGFWEDDTTYYPPSAIRRIIICRD